MSDPPADQPAPAEQHDDHPLRRVSLRRFESLIDQQMRAAEQAGQFRDLPGKGKPLNLDDDSGVPDELRLGLRMLKSAGYAPPWIELQQSIRDDQRDLATWLERANRRWPQLSPDAQAQLRAEYEQKMRDLNKQITTYNLTAPPAAGQLPMLQPWRELRKLGAE